MIDIDIEIEIEIEIYFLIEKFLFLYSCHITLDHGELYFRCSLILFIIILSRVFVSIFINKTKFMNLDSSEFYVCVSVCTRVIILISF